MKTITLLSLLSIALAQSTYYPVTVRNGNSYVYVGFGSNFYSFTLPDLSLAFSKSFNGYTFGYPGSLQGNQAVFSDGGNGSIRISTTDYSLSYDATTAAPASSDPQFFNYTAMDSSGNTFEFIPGTSGQPASVNKTNSVGSFVGSLALTNSVASEAPHNYARVFQVVYNQLYIVAATQQGRGGQDFDYYIVNTDNLNITTGPVRLPNSATSGCPVPPRQCAPPVTLYINIVAGQLVYLYGNGNNGQLQATISAYTPSCGFSSNSFGDNTQPSNSGTGQCTTNQRSTQQPSGTSGNPEATTSSNGNSGSTTSNAIPTVSSVPSTGPTVSSVPSTGPTSTPIDTGDCAPNGCAAGSFCCNGQCYTADRYTCFAQGSTYQLCPAGTRSCGKDCYSPSQYTCLAGNKLCPFGLSACGEACYDTAAYACNNGVLGFRQ